MRFLISNTRLLDGAFRCSAHERMRILFNYVNPLRNHDVQRVHGRYVSSTSEMAKSKTVIQSNQQTINEVNSKIHLVNNTQESKEVDMESSASSTNTRESVDFEELMRLSRELLNSAITEAKYVPSSEIGIDIPERNLDLRARDVIEEVSEVGESGRKSGNKSKPAASLTLPRKRGKLVYDPSAAEFSNLTDPVNWYPNARNMQRKVIYHAGPTNSGKTYVALQALMKAQSGLYAGPLRLLAWEVYEKLNAAGVPCNLITGQEKILVPNARHSACTIETVQLDSSVDVAVLDEIQMVGSSDRGMHWTRCLLGLTVPEIHLCGDTSCLGIMKRVFETSLDDTLELQFYQRLAPLSLVPPLTNRLDFSRIRRGDCIVAFSRKDLYKLKLMIERKTKHKCCIVYGNLPPDLRKQQAELFNSQDEYTVLLATDAIGMGLNLKIRRIVFYSIQKFDGEEQRELTPSEVKQIAGRAGRYCSESTPERGGYVTTFFAHDYPQLKKIINSEIHQCKSIGLLPTFRQVEQFALKKPVERLSNIFRYYNLHAKLSETFFLCDTSTLCTIADLIHRYNLTLQERFTFCQAPISSDEESEALLDLIAHLYSLNEDIPVTIIPNIEERLEMTPRNAVDIQALEVLNNHLELYIWCAGQFGGLFTDVEKCQELRQTCHKLIALALAAMSQPNVRVEDIATYQPRVLYS